MTRITEYRTPGTRLWWSNVREWCDSGYALNRRRLSHKRNRDLETHGMCMPLDLIYRETDLEAVDLAIWFYRHGPIGIRRPQRGHRGDHPSTPIFQGLMNRRVTLLSEQDDVPEGDKWRAAYANAD